MASYNACDVKSEAEYKFGYEFIIEGIIERIKNQFNEFNVKYEKNTINQIYNFLLSRVDGKVWLSFVSELPDFKNYEYVDIELGVHTINLAYGANHVESRFPNALYISITTDYEKKFRLFWAEKYLPTCLLEEAIANLNLTRAVTVHVFEFTYNWRSALVNAKNPIIIGQDIKSKEFKSFRPVGFVDGNFLAITSPNDKSDPIGAVYNFS